MADRTNSPVIIVTGAMGGIGRAAVRALAADGWYVVATDRDEDSDGGVLASLAPGAGEYVAVDLAADDGPDRLVTGAFERLGRLDGLVNVAGIHKLADTTRTSVEDWDLILGLNLRAAFLACRAAIPYMARSGGGVVVNVSSEAGLVAIAGQVAYNVSKAGLLMLTRSIAVDHAAEGIRAVSICPGTTETPLVRRAILSAPDPEQHERHLKSMRPANRLGRPEEIAAAIAFVASPAVAYMTGSELVIDGGFTAT